MTVALREPQATATAAPVARRRFRPWPSLCLLIVYVIVAAAAYNGFYEKWSFRDEDPKFSLVAMLEGEADRPYVYRQLLPSLANAIDARVPGPLKDSVDDRLVAAEGNLEISSHIAADDEYALRYRIVYYLSFSALIGGLFLLRASALTAFGNLESTVAPAVFALLTPIILTIGGYFYDFTEILFMAAAVYVSLRRTFLWLIPLAAIGTLNKESFVFFTLTLWPLLADRYGWRRSALLVAGLAGVAGCVYLGVRQLFADNPGDTAQFHLFSNLEFYANPLNLFAFERTYGLPMFKGYSIFMLGLVAIVAVAGWSRLPRPLQRHALFAAGINVPLLILFCAPGEMRNLSMLYVSLTLLIAAALQRWSASSAAGKVAA